MNLPSQLISNMRIPVYFSSILLAIFLLALSFVGFIFQEVNTISWIAILSIVLLLGLIRYQFVGFALLLELILGGHGYLFSISIFNFPISFRIGLFIVAFITLLYHALRKKGKLHLFQKKLLIPFVALLLLLTVGVIRGFLLNDPTITFFDANAYFSVFYVLFFVESFSSKESIKKALSLLVSASVALGIVTIFLSALYTFFHYDNSLKGAISVNSTIQEQLSGQNSFGQGVVAQRVEPSKTQFVLDPSVTTKTKPASYRWLRDSGVAQISYISGKFFRVFFPSHLYLMPAFFILLVSLWRRVTPKMLLLYSAYCAIIGVALIISYSRSLWLGLVASIFIFGLGWLKQTLHRQRALVLIILLTSIIALLFSFTHIGDLISDRAQSIIQPSKEIAGTHRIELAKALWNQIKQHPVIGTGFGTLVSFPTVLPNGQVITAAFYIFELSYLDITVKLGGIGLIIFLICFVLLIIKLSHLYVKRGDMVSFALVIGFIATLIANTTTPIFTHPLGFGFLGLLTAYIFTRYEFSTPNSNLE